MSAPIHASLAVSLMTSAAFWLAAVAAEPAGAGITHGPLCGEVEADAVVLWARGSGPGVLRFDVSGEGTTRQAEVAVDAATDYAGQVRIDGLRPGIRHECTVVLDDGERASPSRGAEFTTAPDPQTAAAQRFVFGTCLGGQGYCRPPGTGWTIFEAMAAREAHAFVLLGDAIYGDYGCPTEDGRNVAGAETKATDLDGFRARYRYHLEDPAYGRFLAGVPVYVTWDDHEIVDNFGGPALAAVNPALFEAGRQAYFEYWPITEAPGAPYRLYRRFARGAHADLILLDTRSYRDPIVGWDPDPRTGVHKTMLGPEQLDWLRTVLLESRATWKLVVTSVPLSYPTGAKRPEVEGHDGWADGGHASGFENELMSLLMFIADHQIENVAFVTGDTHFPFAKSYDPDRDGEVDFYEFGSSPLSGGVDSPKASDLTFNPTVLYEDGERDGDLFNFGVIDIAASGELTFRLCDREGAERFVTSVTPR